MHKEIVARMAGPLNTWRWLKGKVFRARRLPVHVRIRPYEVLATSQLLSAAETIPLATADQRKLEVPRTSHLRQSHRLPYTAHCPNHAARRSNRRPTVESLLTQSRLHLWGKACRDSPNSFFRATLFSLVQGEGQKKLPKGTVTLKPLIQNDITTLQASLELRDWSMSSKLRDLADTAYNTLYHA